MIEPSLRFDRFGVSAAELSCARCAAAAEWRAYVEIETAVYVSADVEFPELGQLGVCSLCESCVRALRGDQEVTAAAEAAALALSPMGDDERVDKDTEQIIDCIRSILVGGCDEASA